MSRQPKPAAAKQFSAHDRAVLLAVKGVGPTVVKRLEQMGIATLQDLATRDAQTICSEAAALTSGTCWKNSPMARASITSAIAAAKMATAAR